jgi:hypothetical protein
MKSSLKPGRYMKTTSVLQKLSKFPIQQMNANKLTKHIGDHDVYFSTSDLKSVMTEDTFKWLECECTTHVILSESDLQAYNNYELNF